MPAGRIDGGDSELLLQNGLTNTLLACSTGGRDSA